MAAPVSPCKGPAGVFFHGPMYVGSGYADENLHVVLGVARQGIPVQVAILGRHRRTLDHIHQEDLGGHVPSQLDCGVNYLLSVRVLIDRDEYLQKKKDIAA